MLHAPTGLGKTLAVWLGPLAEAVDAGDTKRCKVLWITPLRALAQDTRKSCPSIRSRAMRKRLLAMLAVGVLQIIRA